jgi:hypothetical protein
MIGLPRRECSQRNEPRARLDWSLLLMSLTFRRDRQSHSSPEKSLGDFFLPLWVYLQTFPALPRMSEAGVQAEVDFGRLDFRD